MRVCEGTKQTIHCEAPQKLHIVSANYGRLTGGHICPGPVKTTNCGAAVSQAKVTHNCNGKQECVLEATNGQFGDPCVGTRKYLEVRIIQCRYLYILRNLYPRAMGYIGKRRGIGYGFRRFSILK